MSNRSAARKRDGLVSTQDLSRRQRLAVGAAGAVMVTFAAYAVLKGKDGATSAGFLAAGSVAMLLSLVGFLPLHIKWRDAELDLRREVEQAVDPIASAMNEEELQKTVESLAASGRGVATDTASKRVYEHIGFERSVLNDLNKISLRKNWRVLTSPETGFDAQISFVDQAWPLFVEIRLTMRNVELKNVLSRLKGIEGDVLVFVRDAEEIRRLANSGVLPSVRDVLQRRRLMVIAWDSSTAPYAVDFMATGNAAARAALDVLVEYVILGGEPALR